MNIGLFFGSFNPIHTGHLIIANLAYELTDLDQVWFVVSPQNPFKQRSNLAHEFDRIDMVRAAVLDLYHFQVSDVEFRLARPSYTIHTLVHLSEAHPDYSFRVILGEDNLASFQKWKNYDIILENYGLIVYPRPKSNPSPFEHPNIEWIDAPKMDISATLIRKLIKSEKSPRFLVPDPVLEILESRRIYQD